MADNDLEIRQNNLLPNPFHMLDAKFDLVLRPISHKNPAMPFTEIDLINEKNQTLCCEISTSDLNLFDSS